VAPGADVEQAAVAPCVGVVAPALERTGDRLRAHLLLPLIELRDPQVVPGQRVPGVLLERPAITRLGAGEVAGQVESDAMLVPEFRRSAILADRHLVQGDRRCGLSTHEMDLRHRLANEAGVLTSLECPLQLAQRLAQ
jgi:hypothetical protein